MSLALIYNPVCGDSTAEQFFNDHVVPRLHAANRIPTEIIRTNVPGEAGSAVFNLLNKYKGDVTVVLGSGDGTLHEIVNHLAFSADPGIREGSSDQPRPIHFVLVPCGTANALYSTLFRQRAHRTAAYKLQALEAFLAASTPRPLTLSLISLLGPDRCQRIPGPITSIVVTSTALHATILRDSEKLRKEMPGVERFKVAAQRNITRWYAGHVKLLPTPSSDVIYAYDPRKGDFVPIGDSNAGRSTLDLHGPFAYFLSTVNVDRLEPEFCINPTISKNSPASTSMDIIMIRPKREPTFTGDTHQAREKFAEKVIAVLTTAYQDGEHVNLRYSEDGDITKNAYGNTVVECFRCGGWEWTPDETDENAHLLCVDGTIFEIEKGCQATCKVAPQTDMTLRNFYVHV